MSTPSASIWRSKSFMALGIVCILWGTTWVASRQGVLRMPALQLAGMRQFLGGVIYVIYFTAKKPHGPKERNGTP